MSDDRIDELARELFAAARDERPGRELVARVEREAARDEVPSSQPRVARRGAARERTGLVPLGGRWLLAALVAGGVGVFLLMPRAREGVIISAEHAPSGAPGATVGAEVRRAPGETPLPAPLSEGSLPESPPPEKTPPEALGGAGARRAPQRGASTPARESSPRNEPVPAATNAPGATLAPSPVTPTLSNELGALKQIRQALRGHDGSGALVLLDRYDMGEYGKSLSLEASVLRVEALDAVGRRAEAETLARRFVRDNPNSPLAERAQSFIRSVDPARSSEDAVP